MEIGKYQPEENIGKRDAFHSPVVVVTTKDKSLKPGDHVKFVDDQYNEVVKTRAVDFHAIVDPFLWIEPGTSLLSIDKSPFIVFLVPNSTANLRHNYDLTFKGVEHFEQPKTTEESPLAQIINTLNTTVKELLEKNKQLSDKVDELSGSVEEKSARIEELESNDETYEDDGCRGCY